MCTICVLTLNVQGPSYLGLTRSISWLLMPWLLMSPGHQQPWYWLYRICRSFSYSRKCLSTCTKSMWRNDIKCKYMLMFPQKSLACKGLIFHTILRVHSTCIFTMSTIVCTHSTILFLFVNEKCLPCWITSNMPSTCELSDNMVSLIRVKWKLQPWNGQFMSMHGDQLLSTLGNTQLKVMHQTGN